MDIVEAMKTALDFEMKGEQVYLDAVNKTENKFVKNVFKYLAEQEEKHVREIKMYISSKKLKTDGDIPEKTKHFFLSTIDEFKSKLSLSESDIEAYEKGLELENESYRFYKARADSSKDLDVKSFFEFLMKQEMAHHKLIQTSYDYIKDPSQFNSQNEDWVFEG